MCFSHENTQLRNPSYVDFNITFIFDPYTDYISLGLRVHSAGFELAVAAEIMTRSTTTARLLVRIVL